MPPVNPNGGGKGFGGGGGGGIGQGGGKGKGTVASSPGLITSTGGLQGNSGLLLAPAYNIITQKSFIVFADASNFNCEESSQYTFRQEANFGKIPGEGRECSIHLIILKYRELGPVNFNINITVFKQALDDFLTVSIPVNIPKFPLGMMSRNRKNNFPDKRIHTIKITPPRGGVIQGERPQISITVGANSGPVSITKLILCGNADETAQQ